MPKLINHTPYPNFRYYSADNQNRDFGVIIVKATYELAPSGRLLIVEEQAPLVFTDLTHGALNISSLWHPSDMVPNKPATDVIVNAIAYAPGGRPTPSWLCGIKIMDGAQILLDKQLRVTGPRRWEPIWRGQMREKAKSDWCAYREHFLEWRLTEPEPITQLPLQYEYAYGGEIATGADDDGTARFDTDARNPIGRGKLDRKWTDHANDVPAPQIEDPKAPITEPYKTYMPQNLGPIPPAWEPRYPLGGTYDQNWIDNIWPKWPADYDFAYHNSAHPDLIVTPYLKGGERVTLTGLSMGRETLAFNLPNESIFVDLVSKDGHEKRQDMVLDTVFLDIAAESWRDWRVFLSWRVNFEPQIHEEAIIQRVIKVVSATDLRRSLRERSAA
ncbi:DUF2169 domain-containing protein [Labrys neptuniae]|uniref:DUF2169 family type VI secretion system accessory protein n=1 Tax=Labrys neptuniae TaxID=376174 RepID=UPI00288FAA10|nr:DUF2169 domain-containing protein [Labrys neptuniae]MDT3376340.1 DUF2169 domain-containing protein [Labrys neptuniae]